MEHRYLPRQIVSVRCAHKETRMNGLHEPRTTSAETPTDTQRSCCKQPTTLATHGFMLPRSSSLLFSELAFLSQEKQEGQLHRAHFRCKEEVCEGEGVTDAQAGMPSENLRRNMRSKIR